MLRQNFWKRSQMKFDSLYLGFTVSRKRINWNKNLVHEYFQINIADMNKLIQLGHILRFKI